MPMKPALPILLAAMLTWAAVPAAASEHGAAAPPPAEAGGEDKSAEGKTVTLPTLIAPLVEGQRLAGYLYLSLRLRTDNDDDADRLRDVLPLVQDTLLRALHQPPIPAAEVDSPATKEALAKRVITALAGLSEIHGVDGVAFAEYQSVPF